MCIFTCTNDFQVKVASESKEDDITRSDCVNIFYRDLGSGC